jgi:hypothetical protein
LVAEKSAPPKQLYGRPRKSHNAIEENPRCSSTNSIHN